MDFFGIYQCCDAGTACKRVFIPNVEIWHNTM